jgi:phage major head subunit gpT-like protein
MSDNIRLSTEVTFLRAAEGEAASGPAKFRIVAYTGAPLKQAWSREPVVIDMAGMTLPATIPIVMGHDYALGSILGQGRPSVQGGQLIVEGEILADNDTARQVLALASAGYEWQASVGADVGRHLRFGEDQITTANGQTLQGPVRVVRASTLRETSFVTLGADRSTAVSIAAEDAATEESMAQDATSTPDKAAAESEAPAVVAGGAPINESLPVNAKGGDGAELANEVAKMVLDQIRRDNLQAARDERPAAPAVHVAQPAVTPDVIEASFALQGGLPNVEKHYDEKTLEAAHKARRELSLGEVLVQAAVANGYDGSRRVTASTLRPILAAAWATHSISGILSSTVNKFLLAGFDSVESAWRQISTVRSVNDFKTLTSYRLNGGFKFEQVGNGGELKNAGASDEQRTISADTYGIMTSVTRTDLINDDLGALTAVPQRIGRGGALKLNDVFWTSFQDDSGFFTTARGNKKTSAGALSISTLKTIATMFRKLRDPDGNPVAIEPRLLLVPVDQELAAAEIMGSTLIQSGATGGQPERNVMAGRYQVVASTYLSNVDDFYLLASPADLPVMEVAFLNGVQSPIVETAEADFNTLGVQMRGYFDFGVAKAEYLAGIKADVS